MSGSDGADRLTGGLGDDTLAGGTGNDTADYASSSAAVTVALDQSTQDTIGAGTDTLQGLENLTGGSAADMLCGDGGANASGVSAATTASTAEGATTPSRGAPAPTPSRSSLRSPIRRSTSRPRRAWETAPTRWPHSNP